MIKLVLGLVSGGILGLINFRLLTGNVVKSKQIEKKKIKAFFFISYLKRYILIGLILSAGLFFKGKLFFLGIVIGLLVSFYFQAASFKLQATSKKKKILDFRFLA